MSTPAAAIGVFASVQVDEGPSYAVRRVSRRAADVGPEGSGQVEYREVVWEMELWAADQAATPSVGAFAQQLEADLCGRERRVRLTELGTQGRAMQTPASETQPALPGYPHVEITGDDAERSVRHQHVVTVRATTRIPPAAGEGGLLVHDYTAEDALDREGRVRLSQRGRVRVAPGQSARDYILDEVLAPIQTQAGLDGRDFERRLTLGLDASAAEYDCTVADRNAGGSIAPGVTEADVTDELRATQEGRRVRTVRGYAEGPGAAAYAATLEPAPSPNQRLVRRDVSQPSVPRGRVNFAYEFVSGVTDARWPTVAVYAHRENISQVSGGRRAVPLVFEGRAPEVLLGPEEPYVYTQTSVVEFVGDQADVQVDLLMPAEALAAEPVVTYEPLAFGLTRATLTASYIFDAPQPLPTARTLPGLEPA